MKPQVGAAAARFLTSDFRRKSLHALAELRRRATGRPRELFYFHQVSAPYSHLMVQVLSEFAERFGLALRPFVIGAIQPDMLPEPEMLRDYGVRDAAELAKLYDLKFPPNAHHGETDHAAAAGSYLTTIAQTQPESFFDEATRVGEAYWKGAPRQLDVPVAGWADEGERLLSKLGHYLPGTVWYGGEWYWGLDRLDHLEERLIAAGLGNGPVVFDRTWKDVFEPLPSSSGTDLPPLELFFSARSPYSYVSLFLARRFADATGLELKLRPVLPMMMRNMKVPFHKRLYIVTDTKREATKASLPFGKIADPLGAGIERTYAIANWVNNTHPDLLESYFRSAMTGIATEAIDVATDEGLRKITERARLDWSLAQEALHDGSWKDWIQSNRDTMTELGLWGVPCLRFGDVSAWGQDRFWIIRQALVRSQTETSPDASPANIGSNA